MLVEERRGAVERQFMRRLVEGAALVAGEAVPGAVDVDRQLGPRLLHLFDVAQRDGLVLVAEMQDDRDLRLLAGMRRDRAAVIADGGRGAGQLRRREEGERAAPAIADHRHLAVLLGSVSY